MPHALSSRGRFGLLFVGAARRWRSALDAGLAEVGAGDATWSPLIHVHRAGGGLSQKELAARVGIDGSSLVRLVDILAARGFIERRQDTADRRSNLLFLTPAGETEARRIQRVLTRLETRMLAGLDGAEIAALTAALERIDARIEALRHGAPEAP
ncbi:MarR family winged helix-turn-helix transcriptional regulator [Azorhizobium doebereinerae]|uniref:MarR family winged helix-turn-helix transcriptional regulator n=1 Tax=Azorhizobium doebereinerae TaxID=281091 RepID=UPI00040C9081|nr:MarR family transcriptional regulator [Azorhizobium doebereinerae]